MTLLTPNARCSINTQWAPNSLCNPLACASSDLVLVEALGGRRQGHADHAALRLACLRPPTSSAWLHFEIDADADQCSNDRHAANCVPRGAGGARAVQARQGVGGGRARGLDCKGSGLLTRAADDGPHRARVGAGLDVGRASIQALCVSAGPLVLRAAVRFVAAAPGREVGTAAVLCGHSAAVGVRGGVAAKEGVGLSTRAGGLRLRGHAGASRLRVRRRGRRRLRRRRACRGRWGRW